MEQGQPSQRDDDVKKLEYGARADRKRHDDFDDWFLEGMISRQMLIGKPGVLDPPCRSTMPFQLPPGPGPFQHPTSAAPVLTESDGHRAGTIQVIVAGLPRTGTMSMKKALEDLGYKNPFHLAEPLLQFDNLKKSAEIVHTKDQTQRHRKLASLLEGHEATLEVPGSACLPDLLEMYPDAKVILTEREAAEKWLHSWRSFGIDLRCNTFRWVGYWVPGIVSANELYRGWIQLAAERYGVPPEPSVALYHAHSEWVRKVVPEGRLLVFTVCKTASWKPLCEFLGRERKDEFPHGNEASYLRFYKRVAMVLGAVQWVLILAGLFGAYMFSLTFAGTLGGLLVSLLVVLAIYCSGLTPFSKIMRTLSTAYSRVILW